jgi:capsular polysaccharide biosynthesis protein
MTQPDSPAPAPVAAEDLSFVRTLQRLQRHCRLIIGGAIGTGLLTAIVVLFIPNTFRSTTALIVQEPKIQRTWEAKPLTPEMLIELTESMEVKRDAFDSLLADKRFKEPVDFDGFQRMLSTTVQRTVGPNQALLPMISLNAQASDPDLAMDIANSWAKTVVKKSQYIYSRDIKDVSAFIGKLSGDAEAKRNEAEIKLATQTVASNVELRKKMLASTADKCAEIDTEIRDLLVKTEANKGMIEDLSKTVGAQTVAQTWVGEQYVRSYLAGATDEILASTHPVVRRIAVAAKEVANKKATLLKFQEHAGLEKVRSEAKNYTKEFDEVNSKIKAASQEVQVLLGVREELTRALDSVPAKIVLEKAITDDALWALYTEGRLDPKTNFQTLKTEELNPVRQNLETRLVAVSADIGRASRTVSFLSRRKPILDRMVQQSKNRVDELEGELRSYEASVESASEVWAVYRSQFNTDRVELKKLELEQARAEAQLKTKGDILKNLLKTRSSLEKEIVESEHTLDLLKRDVSKVAGISISLASKTQEMALVQVSAEQTSRSGTAILFRAVANPRKVWPPRAKIVLAAMFLAAVLLVVYGLAKSVIEDAEMMVKRQATPDSRVAPSS